MPDTKLAKSFIATARKLVAPQQQYPSQSDIRLAISTSYFAMFHAIARVAADSLVGSRKSQRPNKAWVEVYRGLSHGPCRFACEQAKNIDFPERVHDFANNFVQIQDARKRADYDPMCRPTTADALFWIAMAENSINALYECSRIDKTAFATWVLITSPGAKQAREVVKNGLGRGLLPQ